MKDKYSNFKELKQAEKSDNFKIRKETCKSNFLIFTPHGGGIEPGTSEICKRIAKNTYSYYSFIGKGNGCKRLHITSTNFDEPILLELLPKHEYAVSIHGMTNNIQKKVGADIFLGGLNQDLIKITTKVLKQHHFKTVNNIEYTTSSLSGKGIKNITNKCSSRKGMQIEISEDLRATFFKGNFKKKKFRKEKTKEFDKFCKAINQSITLYIE